MNYQHLFHLHNGQYLLCNFVDFVTFVFVKDKIDKGPSFFVQHGVYNVPSFYIFLLTFISIGIIYKGPQQQKTEKDVRQNE